MPRYRVTIHGSNLRLKMEGRVSKMGFKTVRDADAPDASSAKALAVDEFCRSAKYEELMQASENRSDDPAILLGEDVEERPSEELIPKRPAGLAFYREQK